MKTLAAYLLVIALVLGAAPMCAAPAQAEAVAVMAGCEDAPRHHEEQHGRKGDDMARACHTCAFPPVANPVLAQPKPAVAVPINHAVDQLSGGALKPPTPPPRVAGGLSLSTFNRS